MKLGKTSKVGLAILAVALVLVAWVGIAYATQAQAVPNGGKGNCNNPQYGVSVGASLQWNQNPLLGDSVSASSKSVTLTIYCPAQFSVANPLGLLNLYSQNGQFQVIATLSQSGQMIGSGTSNPSLTAGQAVPVAVYANNNLAIGNYQLSVVISEQGCYSLPYICGGWPLPSTTFQQVGSFTCSFVVSSNAVSGSVTSC